MFDVINIRVAILAISSSMVSHNHNMPPKSKSKQPAFPKKRKNTQNKMSPGVKARVKLITEQRKGTTNSNPGSKSGALPYAYTKALLDPFSPMALGGRVPDMYSSPTTTLHQRGRTTINANSLGNFSFVWIGNPMVSFWFPAVPGDTNTTRIGTSTCYASTTNATLGAVSASHRCVGNGITITNNQAPLNMTGRIITARLPLGKDFWSASQMAFAPPDSNRVLKKLCGIQSVYDGITEQIPSSIRNLSGASEYSAAELNGRKAYCINKPVSPRAFDFSLTNDNTAYGGGYVEGDSVLVSATGVALNGIGQTNDNDNDGWTCILVRGEGFPFSTNNVITIDTITHLECTPQIAVSDTSGAFVPDTLESTPIIGALDKILNAASKVPVSQLITCAAKVALKMGY